MKKEKKVSKDKGFIDAYRRVRKPAAPPERIIPDKREKIKDLEGLRDMEGLEPKDGYPVISKLAARATVLVSGHVQGVFFRASAQEKANEAGVTGWVRNRVDGRVEAVLEGDKDAIRRVVDWFNVGPAAARVEEVEVFWDNATGEFTGFEQRHTY